ncbi:hypothetical protein Nmel_003461 [Mimus melanotis]
MVGFHVNISRSHICFLRLVLIVALGLHEGQGAILPLLPEFMLLEKGNGILYTIGPCIKIVLLQVEWSPYDSARTKIARKRVNQLDDIWLIKAIGMPSAQRGFGLDVTGTGIYTNASVWCNHSTKRILLVEQKGGDVGIQLESITASTAQLVTTDKDVLAIVGRKPWQE